MDSWCYVTRTVREDDRYRARGNQMVGRVSTGGSCRSDEPWLKGIKSVVAGSINAGNRLHRDGDVRK